jgi:opacity protein-like surface antigen
MTTHHHIYQFGAGLDWQINSNIIASLDYAYQNLGAITSQAGETSWSTSSLSTGKYHINTLMLGLSYLIK